MSDHRLHIADTCTQTGKVLAQHVASVQLTLRLQTRGMASKQYAQHVITLHTFVPDASNMPHPLLVGTFPVSADAQGPMTVFLPVRVAQPAVLMARWYASAFSPVDGVSAQELVACGSLVNGEAQLRDMENTVQGVLYVGGFEAPAPLHTKPNKQAQALVQKVRDAYARVQPAPSPNDKFADMQVQMEDGRAGSMPLLFFTAHATLMRVPDRANATAYFENALRVCSGGVHVHPAQLLADVLSLPSLGWIYRPDLTRTGQDVDQWASLLSFPGGPGVPIAFDCEDGSKALLELLGVLQGLQLVNPTPALVELQMLARLYRGHFCICELKSDNGSAVQKNGVSHYVNHALVVMLPVQQHADLPPITLESTAYCSGAWLPSTSTLASDEDEFAFATRAAARQLGNSAVAVENARIKSPISLVVKQRMYGRVLALVSCSSAAGAEHWLLNMDMATFLSNPNLSTCGAVPAISMSLDALLAVCGAELRMAPVSRFPRAPTAAAAGAQLQGAMFLMPPGTQKMHGNKALQAIQVTDEMTLYRA